MENLTGSCVYGMFYILIITLNSAISLENVALLKEAVQSGTYDGNDANRALDGFTNPDMNTGYCAHPYTRGQDVQPEDRYQEAWWRVDLGKDYDVYKVKIFNRNTLQGRLSKSWVFVSNTEKPNTTVDHVCHFIENGQMPIVEVKCTYGGNTDGYLRGRYVMIQRQERSYDSDSLNICEVEVFSCPERKWGLSANGDCENNCNCYEENCYVADGNCPSKCQDGWFGHSCNESCHCADSAACDRYTRRCDSTECEQGYGGYQHCTTVLPIAHNPTAFYYPNETFVKVQFNKWTSSKMDEPDEIRFYRVKVREVSSGNQNTLQTEDLNWTRTDPLEVVLIAASKLPMDTNIEFLVIPVFKDVRSKVDVEGTMSDPSNSIFIPKPSQNMNIGLIAGIAVAVIVLIVLLIIVIILLVRYRKSGKHVHGKKKEVLITSSQRTTNDHTYENPIVMRQNEDTLQSVSVDDNKYDIPKRSPVNGIIKLPSGSQTPEILPSEDEDGQIYDNPMIIPPIKVSELSAYIEKRKGEADAFKREYQQLPAGDKAKWEVGNKAENRNKNRFVNIRAYDHSRVVLSIVDGDIHSDYINADFITGYKDKPKVYVAAQGPKKCTLIDTWRMMWELNANRIVMVTNLVEGGKLKCEKYWPDSEETYGEYKVVTTRSEVFADYSLKQFELTYKDETRTVYHFHFTSWPDHGVPITATALLNFRRKVRSFDNLATGPMVVHCSAGVGRTGTFIALDTLLEQARVEDEVDVYKYACVMRSNRVNMIQTLEQYIFVYDGLLEALMSGDTSIPCPELASRYEEMKNINPETNKSKLQDQFDVLEVLKPAKREEKLTALEPQNKDKNRDVDIVPSNRFRPFLSIKVEGCTDYINAVYIDGYKMRLAYIITQSPLPNTITDMWRLAYDHASRTIVMLNQLSDGDEDCPVYWPKDKETPLEFEPLTVSLVDETVDSVTPSITVRDFSIVHSSKPNNPVIVKQFHLTNWAEGESLPESKDDILDVMELVERWQQQSGNGPVTIHCRNGCDKSGLYCAASYTVEKLKLDREVDVFHAVKHVRVCRPAVVPTMEQYMYLHELALEYIDKFEIYANFK